MKKIDLHVHTVASKVKDAPFEFDIEKLVSYARVESLDAIAVTNHDLFDHVQFNEIVEKFNELKINTKVFPGVEIDIESGHLLYITDLENIDDFKKSCDLLKNEILKENDSIKFEKFIELFPNYTKSLLIPHGEGKRPILNSVIIQKFKEHISTVEVQNQKKFMALKKSNDTRTPLLFSDVRISTTLELFPKRCTFVDIEDISILALKATLSDKSKVYINNKVEREELFVVNDTGTEASVGLNVVLGARATGKTFLMNQLSEIFPNTKYIKQFQLLSNETKSDETFKSNIDKWLKTATSTFLREYSNTVRLISDINLSSNDVSLKEFAETLLGNASDLEINDEFSKCRLFNADKLNPINLTKLKSIINALELLLNPGEDLQQLIDSYIDSTKMRELTMILISDYEKLAEEEYIIEEANKVIDEVREGLKQKTAVTQISIFNEIDYLSDKLRASLFDQCTIKLRLKGEFLNYDMHGFKVVAECIPGDTVTAAVLKEINDNKGSFNSLKPIYKNPYEYLKEMQSNVLINTDNLVKLLVPTKVRVLNKYGKDVSGGEKSEFNLLNALNDAYEHDMLIVDEPESSFDNVFLNKNVNSILKDISCVMPVFVVTHNNSIGASIKPDYLIYTEMSFSSSGEIQYNIFTGKPTSKYLRSVNGLEIENYLIQMKSLEGGQNEYQQRKIMYEGIEKV